MARKISEINAGSMADIAFLLLIFFLVTTTMDVDTGITRKLPPMPQENQEVPDVNQRNVFVVLVNANDQLMVENKRGNLETLREDAKEFLRNPYNKPNLSEKKTVNINLLGEMRVSKGVISLRNDRGTSYEMYIQVQNELAAAVRELRDELAKEKFQVKFDELKDEERIVAIKKAIPVAISEAEPKNLAK